jgi:hypothetical protein
MHNIINKPHTLPNLDCFEFVGINKQNKKGNCYVAKNSEGFHVVKGEFSYNELIAWENKSNQAVLK